jgi:hypothetical protein
MSKKRITGWIAAGVAGVVLLIVVLNALSVVSVFWQADKAQITVPAREKIFRYGTGNAVTNIAYFHTQCNDVLGDEQNVVNATQALRQDSRDSRSTDPIKASQAQSLLQQDETYLIGAKDQLSNDVRDYDARSASSLSAPFKESGLPQRISIDPRSGELAGSVNCN